MLLILDTFYNIDPQAPDFLIDKEMKKIEKTLRECEDEGISSDIEYFQIGFLVFTKFISSNDEMI